jgi:hypothetical protein
MNNCDNINIYLVLLLIRMLSLFHFEVRYCILASDTNFKSYQGNTFLLLDHKEFLTDDKCLYIFVLIRPFRTSSVLL